MVEILRLVVGELDMKEAKCYLCERLFWYLWVSGRKQIGGSAGKTAHACHPSATHQATPSYRSAELELTLISNFSEPRWKAPKRASFNQEGWKEGCLIPHR
ncbi:hypothetical protein Y1Q_0007157 [Alligator mississippiensis]|uniref:Uncharacterized protein n=1 Tax=Alligator mississippiensis TaxID=8496 RepID=A0A151N628_ALLMI|nr:hypothetical protein Y1Q_0007157 [Alligator mississippiensis]